MPLGGRLGASWGPLGGLLGPLGGLLGASWGFLEASWGLLGASSGGRLELSVRVPPLGPLLGPSWGSLGLSWAPLGPFWGPLGPSWGPLGSLLGRLGAILVGSGRSAVGGVALAGPWFVDVVTKGGGFGCHRQFFPRVLGGVLLTTVIGSPWSSRGLSGTSGSRGAGGLAEKSGVCQSLCSASHISLWLQDARLPCNLRALSWRPLIPCMRQCGYRPSNKSPPPHPHHSHNHSAAALRARVAHEKRVEGERGAGDDHIGSYCYK